MNLLVTQVNKLSWITKVLYWNCTAVKKYTKSIKMVILIRLIMYEYIILKCNLSLIHSHIHI